MHEESSGFKKTLLEIVIQFTFQTPVYSGILAVSGVPLENIPSVSAPGVLLCTAVSRLYGKYQDFARKTAGVPGAYAL